MTALKPPQLPITLSSSEGEPRIDSRLLLAKQLDNQHENTFDLIKRYEADFLELGVLRFKTGKPPAGPKGGRPEQYVLLNEDQSYLLLTYSRNTPKVRWLKVNLVKAFREARDHSRVTDAQYLPFYHALHEEVSALAQRAKECGNTTPEHIFHINANKVLNAALGITAGQREALTLEQQLLLTTLQAVYRNQLHASLVQGNSHREAGRKAKASVGAYMATAGGLLLEAA